MIALVEEDYIKVCIKQKELITKIMSKKIAEENERICKEICAKYQIETNSHIPEYLKPQIEIDAIMLGAKYPKNILKIITGDIYAS